MEKLILDRLNHLNSDLSDLTSPKLTKRINEEKIKDLRIRIDELFNLLEKVKKHEIRNRR